MNKKKKGGVRFTMSYKPYENEDSLSELFSRMADFNLILKNLLNNNDNIDNFMKWFYKACQIDMRSCALFLAENYDSLSREVKDYVNATCVGKYVQKARKNLL